MSNGQSTLYGAGTVKRAFGTASLIGDNVVVAAVAGKRIRVLAYVLSTAFSVNAVFQDNDGAIGGVHASFSLADVVLPYLEVGWVETKKGGRLDLNLSAANAVFFLVLYVEVP